MNTKRLVLTLALVAGIAAPLSLVQNAEARGGHQGGAGYGMHMNGMGGGFSQISPEKQQAATEVMKEFDTRLLPLREQIQAKHMELDALSSNPNTKPESLSKLSAEIAALQTKIRTEYQARDARLSEVTGLAAGPGWGHGRGGHGGYGRHNGGHNGGYYGGQHRGNSQTCLFR